MNNDANFNINNLLPTSLSSTSHFNFQHSKRDLNNQLGLTFNYFEYLLRCLAFRQSKKWNTLLDFIAKKQFALNTINNTIQLMAQNNPFEEWVKDISNHYQTREEIKKSISRLNRQLVEVEKSYEQLVCFLETKFLVYKQNLLNNSCRRYQLVELENLVTTWFDNLSIKKQLLYALYRENSRF